MTTLEAKSPFRPLSTNDFDLLFEHLDASPRFGKVEPICVVLGLMPSGSHPQFDPSPGDVVGGHNRFRKYRRVSERHWRHHRSQPDPVGKGSQPRKRGPCVERSTICLTLDREVMVGSEQALESALLAAPCKSDPVLPGNVLLTFDHQAQPHTVTSE